MDAPPRPPAATKQAGKSSLPAVPNERVDLMASIRASGPTALKPVTESHHTPKTSLPRAQGDSRGDLLESIRNAKATQLRPAAQNPIQPSQSLPPPSPGGNDLAGALRLALAGRQAAMVVHSDDEADDDDEEDW